MTGGYVSFAVLNAITSTGFLLLLVCTAAILFRKSKKKLKILLLSLIGTGIITVLIKFLVRRQRPLAPEYFFGAVPDFSFPSLHTALAFATMPFLWKHSKYRYFSLMLVLIIIVNRIYSQEHYWSDVFAGAIIGLGISFGLLMLIKWRKK